MGPIYTLEYKNMIDKERKLGAGGMSPTVEKNLRKIQLSQANKSNLVVLREKF